MKIYLDTEDSYYSKVYKLGRSIAQIVPFQIVKQIVEHKDKIPFKMIILVSLAVLIIKIVTLQI